MSFEEFLGKAAGTRFRCACECCGEGHIPPPEAGDGIGFDRLFAVRLMVSSLLFAAALIVGNIPQPWPLVMLIISAVLSGYDMAAAAIRAVILRNYYDKCVLILTAAVLTFAFGQSAEGAALVLLFQLGGALTGYAFTRTRQSVLSAVSCDAENAHLVKKDGGEDLVPAGRMAPGDRIMIYPGERVPCDGVVLEGSGNLDASPLGGGEDPLFAAEGDEILSGCINLDGTLRCEVTAAQVDSAAAAMLRSVRSAFNAGFPVPRAMRRFLDLYTPVMLILTVLVAGILPLIYKIGITYAIRRALVFLVIANPCAMVVALPLIRFCGIGKSAGNGVLFSGMAVMEKASHTAAVIFDKSGALTNGSLRVTSVKSERIDAETFLKITAHALAYSDSPTARAVISSYGGTIYIELIQNFSESPGKGVEVHVDGVRICAGNLEFMAEKSVAVPETDATDELAVYVSIATSYAGRILFADSLRKDAAAGVEELTLQGVDAVIMLTGDRPSATAKTAAELKIKEYYSGCNREQKLATVSDIRQSLPEKNTLMFVGGRDLPGREHTGADIDAAICDIQALSAPAFADITVLNGKVSGIASAIATAKYSDRFAYLTTGAVLAVKLIVLVLAFLGIATLWFAIFIDYAAALGAILCAILVQNAGPQPGGRKLLRK